MAEHSSLWLRKLLDVTREKGGGRMVIVGDEMRKTRSGALMPYWSGARFDGVETLLEAVLRPLLAASYARIVAFTGHGLDHLPRFWKLGSSFQLGDEAFIWLVKGGSTPPPTAPPPQNAQTAGAFTFDTSRLPIASQATRLIWRSTGHSYWDRIDELIARRDSEIETARAKGERVAIVIDERFLRPTPFELHSLARSLELEQRRSASLQRKFTLSPDLGPADIFVIAENGLVTEMLDASGNYIASAAMTISGKDWEHYRASIEPVVPRLFLGAGFTPGRAQRRELPYRTSQLTSEKEASCGAYEFLRSARLEARPSMPEPPAEMRQIALEFWANLDLTPLARAFAAEVIGQEETTSGILAILEEYRDVCREVLSMDASAERTNEDRELRPPVISLFGAAGMGKTTICKIMGRELFGSDRYMLIELTKRRLATLTIGVNAPFVGWDQETMLTQFARETRGLGLLCFDELTLVELEQGQQLSDALNPLLDLIDTRSFLPTNPVFRPPEKRYYMSNMLFMFAANVSAPEKVRPGFKSIEDLGEPLRSRLFEQREPFFFDPLKPDQYREATRRSVIKRVRQYAASAARKHEHLVHDIAVEDSLLDVLVATFGTRLNASGETASLRVLDGVTRRLKLGPTFQCAIQQQSPRLIVGLEALPIAETRR